GNPPERPVLLRQPTTQQSCLAEPWRRRDQDQLFVRILAQSHDEFWTQRQVRTHKWAVKFCLQERKHELALSRIHLCISYHQVEPMPGACSQQESSGAAISLQLCLYDVPTHR